MQDEEEEKVGKVGLMRGFERRLKIRNLGFPLRRQVFVCIDSSTVVITIH